MWQYGHSKDDPSQKQVKAITLNRQLDERLKAAQAALFALTPARGRSKRQFTDQAELIAAAIVVLKRYQVTGLLDFTFEQELEASSHAVSRGAANRLQQLVERVRFQMTAVSPNEPTLTTRHQSLAWRPFVTTASLDHLSFADAVGLYRQEFSIERGFARLKSSPLSIAPVFVRRALHDSQQQLFGLHLENPRKAMATPPPSASCAPLIISPHHYSSP